MAATPNSIYQAVLLQHIANNPPNAQPRQSNETDRQYLNRMFTQGLNPDIARDESDSDYLARLASYNPTAVLTVVSCSYAGYADTAGSVHSSSIITP
jgi:hypothetical protein